MNNFGIDLTLRWDYLYVGLAWNLYLAQDDFEFMISPVSTQKCESPPGLYCARSQAYADAFSLSTHHLSYILRPPGQILYRAHALLRMDGELTGKRSLSRFCFHLFCFCLLHTGLLLLLNGGHTNWR